MTLFCYVCNHIRIKQHRAARTRASEEARGEKKRYSEAAKPLKRCYLPLTPALDLATPASTPVAPSGISVDRERMRHCVSGLAVQLDDLVKIAHSFSAGRVR